MLWSDVRAAASLTAARVDAHAEARPFREAAACENPYLKTSRRYESLLVSVHAEATVGTG